MVRFLRRAARPPARGRGQDRVDDRLVAGAAADVAGDRLDHLGAASGCGLRSSSALAAISMPGVQKPHWAAKWSMKACCSGCRSGPFASPSRSRPRGPRSVSASVRQERCGSPSISTVQTPQVPWPQPYFGAVSPTPVAEARRAGSRRRRRTPPTSAPLWRNWTGVLRHRAGSPEQQAAQMHRQHLAPVPGAGDRVGRRARMPSAATASAGAIPAASRRPPFERALDRLGADRASAPSRRRRRARPAMRPPDSGRWAAIERTEMPFGLTRDDLAEAEGARARRAVERHAARRARAPRSRVRQELLERHARARRSRPAAHDRGVQREQRRREVAVGRGREEVAADRRRAAHRRAADRARDRVEEVELAAARGSAPW